jgi:GMP synthase-like glutamine amidotransferase
MPKRQKCLQWHSVCVAQPPDDAVVLAKSDVCRIQAMRVGEHAWSMQYHVEVEPDTVANWAAVPAYKKALESTLGADALNGLKADADANMSNLNQNARQLYKNFKRSLS